MSRPAEKGKKTEIDGAWQVSVVKIQSPIQNIWYAENIATS